MGSERSEKSNQSARRTWCAESWAKFVVWTYRRLANDRSTSSSSPVSTASTVPSSLSLRTRIAASLVLGSSIFQSSITQIRPISARSLSAESRARRTIFFGVRWA